MVIVYLNRRKRRKAFPPHFSSTPVLKHTCGHGTGNGKKLKRKGIGN